jgi:hypothetical protein
MAYPSELASIVGGCFRPIADIFLESYFEAHSMKKHGRLDFEQRAREKQLAREADEDDLQSGRRSAEEIRQSNSMFAGLDDGVFDRARIIFPEKK